jgi:cell division protein FtsW
MDAAVKPGPTRNHIDFAALVAVLALMLLSLGIIYSASSTIAFRKFDDSEHLLVSHLARVGLALLALFVAMRIDYHRFMKLTKPALVAAVGFLTLTLLAGAVSKGAMRWLSLGPLQIQPSEFAKYALLFHICTLISVKGDQIRDFRKGFLPMMVWVGIVAGLVVLQPNFSMASMIVLLSLVMLFVGGVKLKHLALTVAPVVPAMIGILALAPYRVRRIHEYIDAVLGEFGAGSIPYQLRQGLIAFGRGGIFGVGPGESRQRDLFLPEAHTDFVFSILGEEYGFVGTIFFMLLFLLILYRGYKIARFAPDVFGRNLAVAVTSTVTLYALINAGVTLGLLPTTGLPMPFVSFGGSSMLFTAGAVGVLLNISSQTDLHPRATQVPVVGSVNAGKAAVGKVY